MVSEPPDPCERPSVMDVTPVKVVTIFHELPRTLKRRLKETLKISLRMTETGMKSSLRTLESSSNTEYMITSEQIRISLKTCFYTIVVPPKA